MKYYKYWPNADKYSSARYLPDSWAIDLFYDDRPLLLSWEAITMRGFDDNPRRDGDFPSINEYCDLPLVSERAWMAMRELIGDCCEALPIIYPYGGPHFIIHLLNTIDALDADLAEVRRRKVNNSIAAVYRYAFKPDVLAGQHMFKLPLKSGGGLYFDEELRRVIEEHKLQGLLFQELSMVAT